MTSPMNSDSDNKILLDYLVANTAENDKKTQLSKLYQVENFTKKYAYKETLKVLAPFNCERFKKLNFTGNEYKINNMLSPYKHLEYSPNSKRYNLQRDAFKNHVEEVLKNKHLDRGEVKKAKKH